jgi:hypothetical protein
VDSVLVSLGAGPWIVRSSSTLEDSLQHSNAGAFLSVLDVDLDSLEPAIDRVAASYDVFNEADEVLIMPMLKRVVRSGVAFSHDPNTCSPTRVVNWSETDRTDSVTSGAGGRLWQQAARSPIEPIPAVAPVLKLLEELLEIFDGSPLDCEFATTREGETEVLWLLQVRPLLLRSEPQSEVAQASILSVIEQKVIGGMKAHPFLLGQRTVYGVMPDWNPAEIIGIRPRPLALSLYREMITDAIWAYQRHNYGYRNLRSFPLMPHFAGLPYIDVRVSFNSFIPADVDDRLGGRLVDYYVGRLLSEPSLHDKVEFEIVFSCFTLDLPGKLKRLRTAGFSEEEVAVLAASLKSLTNGILHPKHGLWRSDAAKLKTLALRRGELLSSSSEPVEKIYWLLEDAKRYGTLPFAGLARAGFVAVQMLRSLVGAGVLTMHDADAFLAGITTVSGKLARDRATMDKAGFLARYGHLRPGTYDILSPRYDEAPDRYFDWDETPQKMRLSTPQTLTTRQMLRIDELLGFHGLETDSLGLIDFMQAAIELREFAKFCFTQNLSDALSLIGDVGLRNGFTLDDMSYCDISVFKEMHVAATDEAGLLSRSIEQGAARYSETLTLSLPPLIRHPSDVWGFEAPKTSPNFITQKQVTAPVVVELDNRSRLEGSIICIPSADPGFDWLFACGIAGLVTAWGGANSHMAIRAGELGLPAVIGAGEMYYREWSKASRLHLDCAGRRVEVIA